MRTTILALATLLACASLASARSRDNLPGSAIALEYTLKHDVIRPRESVTLLACVTNQNPFSGREVATGDEFSFVFRGGALGACGGLTVHAPGGDLAAADFECAVDGPTLTLRYVGSGAAWRAGDCACAKLGYDAPDESLTVLTSQRVRNEGAFSHPTPAAVLLSVADGLGSVGPMGPEGPIGPVGPEGPVGPAGRSGVGNHVYAESTAVAWARANEPAVPVPGLDVTLDVQEGSRVLALLDAVAFGDGACFSGGNTSAAATDIQFEFDGVVIPTIERLPKLSWTSAPLAAGAHRMRVLVFAKPSHPLDRDRSLCVGGTDLDTLSRLSAIELRAP